VSALAAPERLRHGHERPLVTRRSIHLDASAGDERALEILKALASEPRMAILRYLGDRVVPVSRLARDLRLPQSTANMHVSILERVGLLHTEMEPASRGLQKVCARTYDELVVDLPRGVHHTRDAVEQSMPVGGYSEFAVEPTCGLAGATGLIGYLDDPNSFYEPGRVGAQLIWFRSGYVEYRFPDRVPPGARIDSLQLSAEVCSEAPLFDLDYPSDISIWVNEAHLGAWTCTSDFGGQRGRLTPAWWPVTDSQYGVLKRWRVTSAGTTVDGVPLSGVTLQALELMPGRPIRIRIGVRRKAPNVGGVNIFGRGFGNYPQDIELRIEYDADPATAHETDHDEEEPLGDDAEGPLSGDDEPGTG
jgi:predicted transcriptional regulator